MINSNILCSYLDKTNLIINDIDNVNKMILGNATTSPNLRKNMIFPPNIYMLTMATNIHIHNLTLIQIYQILINLKI